MHAGKRSSGAWLIYINIKTMAVGYLARNEKAVVNHLNSSQGRNVMPSGRISVAVAAGAAGGLAEVVWIAAVATALGADGWAIARAVGATVIPGMAASSFTPWIGLAIHFLLSIALASVMMRVLGRQRSAALRFLGALGALAAVWVFNFFLLLPLINPAFVSLMPHPVTLVSKLLFGVAMAAVLVWGGRESSPVPAHNERFPMSGSDQNGT